MPPEASTMFDLNSLINTLGVVGVLVWYLFYNTRYAIPGIVERQNETVRSIVNDLKEERKFDRESRHREIEMLTHAFMMSAERIGMSASDLIKPPLKPPPKKGADDARPGRPPGA